MTAPTQETPPPGDEMAAAPIAAGERFVEIDTLRGVAVLGILVMNIYAFAMPFAAYNNPLLMGGTDALNLGTWFVTHIFFDQKFMTIFSLLFGGGLIIMFERAERRGADFGRMFFRRQFWLLVIGALHAYLIWFGDILFHYALMGMFAYAFRRRSPRSLIVIALLMLPVAPLISAAGGTYMSELGTKVEDYQTLVDSGQSLSDEQQAAMDEWTEFGDFIAPTEASVAEQVQVYRGDYPGIVRYRAPMVVTMQRDATLFLVLWRVGGLMLLGMALMKLRVLSGQRDAAFYKRMALAGYGLGLPVMLVSSVLLYQNQWDGLYMFSGGSTPNYIGSVLVAFGHIAAVMLVVKSGALSGLMARFAAVGRMALSNYLTHSIVMTTVFFGYGFGLYASVPRAAQQLFVVAMLALQLWYSPLWLKAFRFGPAEWLWRSLTYGQRQPFRR